VLPIWALIIINSFQKKRININIKEIIAGSYGDKLIKKTYYEIKIKYHETLRIFRNEVFEFMN
jgi:hypothetical protein